MRDNIQIITIKDTDICTDNNRSEFKLILKMTPQKRENLGVINAADSPAKSGVERRVVSGD